MSRFRGGILAIIMIAMTTCADATTYQIHVLSTPVGNSYNAATDINLSGTVVGYSTTSSTATASGYVWGGSGSQSLGSISNKQMAINDQGTIVGGHYVWQNGVKSGLPAVNTSWGSVANTLMDINNSGVVAGTSQLDNNPTFHAVTWGNLGLHDLGVSEPYSAGVATSINDNGDVLVACGYALTGFSEGFVLKNGTKYNISRPDGTNWIDFASINGLAQVVGDWGTHVSLYVNGVYVGSDNALEAYLWQNGNLQSIGLPGYYTAATDINDKGQIVGYARLSDIYHYGTANAVIWDDGVMSTLPSLGGNAWANAINENGWIVGRAMGTDGVQYAVEWQPIVPEPASLIALAGGLGLLIARKRRG